MLSVTWRGVLRRLSGGGGTLPQQLGNRQLSSRQFSLSHKPDLGI